MEDQGAAALALEVVIRMLVSREKERDPKFGEQALNRFDEFLGHLATEPREEIFVEARKRLNSILNTSSDLFATVSSGNPQPLTWKRRFLLWLMK